MKKFTFDISVDAWIKGIEIEANDRDEALEELYSYSLEDLLRNGYLKDSDITDYDYDEEDEDSIEDSNDGSDADFILKYFEKANGSFIKFINRLINAVSDYFTDEDDEDFSDHVYRVVDDIISEEPKYEKLLKDYYKTSDIDEALEEFYMDLDNIMFDIKYEDEDEEEDEDDEEDEDSIEDSKSCHRRPTKRFRK